LLSLAPMKWIAVSTLITVSVDLLFFGYFLAT
jgi:hypothetical protein